MEIVPSLRRDADERPRILVVQPKKAYLAVLVRRLVEAGYRVTAAESGSAAIAELHRLPLDLILAELNMPHMSGVELARIVRGETGWRDLPVMLIAGRSDSKSVVRAFDAGADDVIAKPFHFEVLFARMNRRITRSRSIKELRVDNATLDGRVVERAIQAGEYKQRLLISEAERLRLAELITATASR
jgi:two-component system, OmpR family, phosphate regulon response regulator PhoB